MNANLFDQDINGWDTGSVTNFGSMFSGRNFYTKGVHAFNQNINGWNTANAKSFGGALSPFQSE